MPVLRAAYYAERARARVRALLSILEESAAIKDEILAVRRARLVARDAVSSSGLPAAQPDAVSLGARENVLKAKLRERAQAWNVHVDWLEGEWRDEHPLGREPFV